MTSVDGCMLYNKAAGVNPSCHASTPGDSGLELWTWNSQATKVSLAMNGQLPFFSFILQYSNIGRVDILFGIHDTISYQVYIWKSIVKKENWFHVDFDTIFFSLQFLIYMKTIFFLLFAITLLITLAEYTFTMIKKVYPQLNTFICLLMRQGALSLGQSIC